MPSNTAAASAQSSASTRSHLLAIIATVLVVGALRVSEHVTLPLVLGLFMVVLSWPLERTLERQLPRALAITLTSLAVIAVIAIIASAFVWSAIRVAERGPEIQQQLRDLRGHVVAWAGARGVPLGQGGAAAGGGEGLGAAGAAERFLRPVLGTIYSGFVTLALAFAFLVLGLLEVRDFETKVAKRLRARAAEEVLQVTVTIATRVRRYLIALTITSAISGVATGLFALALGLDLAPLWGLSAFLLNYIPTVGPAVAVVPPTLYALLQFGPAGKALAVLAGLGAIQFTVGNFIDPRIEGKVLSLSPALVLFAIAFWGWLWGPFGALLAVPITAALVIVADQFPSTRWIAALAGGVPEEDDEEDAGAGGKARRQVAD